MARRSLRPHLNQIRTWVRQGRTDAWIAHQLEATVQQIEAFRKEHELLPDGAEGAAGAGADFDDEIDLRAEDDALIAAELEAAEAARAEEEAKRAAEAAERGDEPDEDEAAAEDEKRGRRRGRRGGRTRARAGPPRSRAPSTTARRATGSGSTRPSPTTRSTPSTGPATGPSS